MAENKTQEKAAEAKPVIKPEDLATELGVSGKRIRAFLRTEFPRKTDEKNTSWALTEKQAQAVRERFTPSEDEDSDES
jgi:hypothetical protein